MTVPLVKNLYEPQRTSQRSAELIKGGKENRSLDHIPGDYGWPVIGNSFRAVLDNLAMYRELYAKHGPVVRNYSMSQRYVALLSPDAVEYVLLDKQRNFSNRLGWQVNIGRFFDGGLMLLDFDVHHVHRQLVQTAFRTAALEEYLGKLLPHMNKNIGAWDSSAPVYLYPAVKKMALTAAGSAFLGIELESELEVLGRAFVDVVGATTAFIRRPIPGLSYWRGIRGRRILESFFRTHITRKRQGDDPDIFSRLCRAKSDDGDMLTDDEIVAHMVFLMVAGHDTTTSALTMMAYELAKHPQWQEQCRREAVGLNTMELSYDDLKRLERLDWTFREVARLYPPIPIIPRRTLRECEIGGHRIPANTTVILNVGFVQRMPEWWNEPDKFDPLRFSPTRMEHRRHPYSWFPFGGGAHLCSGMYLALMQVKAFYFLLLQKYGLRLTPGYQPKFRHLPMPRPVDGLPLELVRL